MKLGCTRIVDHTLAIYYFHSIDRERAEASTHTRAWAKASRLGRIFSVMPHGNITQVLEDH